MKKNEIVATLKKNGAKEVKNLTVKSVTVAEMEDYVRLGLTLDKPVKGFIQQEDGSYAEGETNTIFVSTYAVGANLRDNADAAFAVNHLIENPKAFGVILSCAKINIIQEEVAAGTVYVNPFASKQNDDAAPCDHDMVINHIVGIELDSKAVTRLEKLADSLLGF